MSLAYENTLSTDGTAVLVPVLYLKCFLPKKLLFGTYIDVKWVV